MIKLVEELVEVMDVNNLHHNWTTGPLPPDVMFVKDN